MDYGKNSAGLGNLVSQQNYAAATEAQTASASILHRLNSIRSNLSENSQHACVAADKIVGAAPTPLNGAGQIKGERPPSSCFIDALQQVITDIESHGNDLQEHLNRIHRAF